MVHLTFVEATLVFQYCTQSYSNIRRKLWLHLSTDNDKTDLHFYRAMQLSCNSVRPSVTHLLCD